jgi:dihydrofolate synthase/folylpolyglutamate synthase
MGMNLEQWLQFQQQVHPRDIALGLERIAAVAARLGLGRPARHVISVGGTNGKGSTVAFIEAIARAAGHRVGAYTSPHLLRYNERVRIDGVDATDAALVAAFERIEAARADTPLTYFEFGTLAALILFAEAKLDLAIPRSRPWRTSGRGQPCRCRRGRCHHGGARPHGMARPRPRKHRCGESRHLPTRQTGGDR